MDFRTVFTGRFFAFIYSAIFAVFAALAIGAVTYFPKLQWIIFFAASALTLIGICDLVQSRHAIWRNYPIIGHLRFLFEKIGTKMRQYLFESDPDGRPFPRERRAIVYQHAKRELDKKTFGTQGDVYAEGHEWMLHSVAPALVTKELFRVTIGGPHCSQPYSASVLNMSAMSYGALSANAICTLNLGATWGRWDLWRPMGQCDNGAIWVNCGDIKAPTDSSTSIADNCRIACSGAFYHEAFASNLGRLVHHHDCRSVHQHSSPYDNRSYSRAYNQ